MMSEENKALVRRWFDGVPAEQIARIPEFFPADYVCHYPDRDVRGLEELRRMVSGYVAAFPDIKITVEDQVAEGEKVVTRWTNRATHQGALEGLAPTGKSITFAGITISRIENGKIVEEWELWDEAGVMRQLGVGANLPA